MPGNRIKIRGARSPIPGGTVMGRRIVAGAPRGDMYPMTLNDLQGIGVAGAAAVAAVASKAGFSFFEEGLMLAGELLGQGSWPHPTTFSGFDPQSFVCASPAASSSALLIKVVTAGVPTTAGTLTYAAGALIGALVWSPEPTIIPAGSLIQLYAPAVADATLAGCSGSITGVSS